MPLSSRSRLGAYEIVSAIGAGGMGEVYRARDSKLNRDVAIKVLPPSFAADADRLKRFEQEARTAGSLNHPNLVTIFELGLSADSPYIVMELVEGDTLRQRLNASKQSPRKAADFAMQIASGLAAAHDRGIVHRDLKPENIIVTPDGRLKILDFGLAKALDSNKAGVLDATMTSPAGTSPGTVLGTVGYMAPEQVRGEATIDHRADIFALGAILYEMLSGRRAFHGASAVETMNAILHEEPPELARGETARIAQRCLEKSPSERFQSARDLAFHLSAVVGDSGLRHAAVESASSGVRSRGVLFGAGALAILLTGATIGWALRRPSAIEPARLETFTYSGDDSSPAASADGKTIAFSSARNGTRQIWLKHIDGSGETARSSGPDDRSPRFSPDGASLLFLRQVNGRLDLFRTAVLGGEERRVIHDVTCADWSPDGASIVFGTMSPQGAGIIGIIRADGSGRRDVLTLQDWAPASAAWSPDGRWLAASLSANEGSRSMRTLLIPAGGGEPRELSAASGIASTIAWTGAGREIVYALTDTGSSPALRRAGSGTARIVAHDIESGTIRTLLWTLETPLVVDVVSTGTLIFDGIAHAQNLRLVPLAPSGRTAAEPRWLTRGSSIDRQPSLSPDGQSVIFASNRSRNLDLWTYSRRDGSIRRLTDDASADWDPAYTPDGTGIIWSSNRSGHFEIWMAALDGSGARQVTTDGVDAENPTMSPDGTWIVYYSANPAKPGVWKIHPDGTGATVLAAGVYGAGEISPDGRHVAFLGARGTGTRSIFVRRLVDGGEVPFGILVEGNGSIERNFGRLRWVPGGKAIAFCAAGPDQLMGLFAQDFVPGTDTTASRRKLAGFFTDARTESFGFAPDGSVVVISGVETSSDILLAHGIQNLPPPIRGRQ